MATAQGDITLVSLTTTDVSCGGFSDGTITIEVTGGVGNLNFTLLDESFSFLESSGFISNRTYTFDAGGGYPKNDFYTVLVGDLNSGTQNLQLFPVAIGGPDTISIDDVIVTDINCATFNDGTITVLASGEQGTFEYELSGPVNQTNTTGFFDFLPTGTYSVTVSDETSSCPSTDTRNGLFVDIPPLLEVSVDNVVDVACFGESTGEIEITPSGGTPYTTGDTYRFAWTGPNGFTSTQQNIFSLETGDYEVTVTDSLGCIVTSGNINVGTASQIQVSVDTYSNVRCHNGNDGSVEIIPSGGTPAYTFGWSGQNTPYNSALQNPSDLVADTYDLTITDNATCSRVFPGILTITEPDPITQVVDSTRDVSCFNGSDGSAYLSVSGGTGALTYSWTGDVSGYTSSQEDPTGMPADTYTLEIEDINNCIETFPGIVTIDQPQDITAVLTGSTDVTCNGGNDGSAQVDVANGTPGYTFLWTGDGTGHTSTDEDPVDLVADTYDLQVTDANGCVKLFNDIVTIDEPGPITITTVITDVNCNGGFTGEIQVTPAGGTSPYIYTWTGPNGFTGNTKDISGLEAGSYDLTIRDANNCEQTFSNITVDENTAINANFSITPLTCNGSGDGEIGVSVSGGVAPYLFSWTDGGSFNSTDEDLQNLDAGSYTLTVTDDAGCVEVFPGQVVPEPDPLAATFIHNDVRCFGDNDGSIDVTAEGGTAPYTYLWTGPSYSSGVEDPTGLAPGDYSLLLEDDNGCSQLFTDAVTIVEPPDITLSATFTNITCNGNDDGTISLTVSGGTPGYTIEWTGPSGYTGTGAGITGLGPGFYNVTVTDANSCIEVDNGIVEIIEPPAIVVTLEGQTNITCNGDSDGAIDITVTGGVPPYSFQWKDSLGAVVSTDTDPVGLPAGKYDLEITDNSGCFVAFPEYVTLSQPEELNTTLSGTDVICYGGLSGTINAVSTGGTAPYEYSFMGGPFDTQDSFTGLSKGTYNITTRDASGCETDDQVTIDEPSQLQFIEYGVSGQILCNGDSTATITITLVTGGVPPYQYSIDGGSTYQSSGTFPNLPAGDYPVRVMDDNLCVRPIPGPTGTLSIDQPTEIGITFYDQDDITTCYESETGEITIIAAGGTGDLSYSLDGGTPQALGQFDDLIGGFHDIRITDENSCVKDTTVELSRPAELVIDAVDITDVTGCPGNNNGEVELTVSGGTPPYSYSDDGITFQPGNIFSMLTAGNYTFYVEDNNGCLRDTAIEVTEPDPILITKEAVTAVSCNGLSDGVIDIDATGGTPPYTYALDPPLLPSNGDGIFNGLPAGDYTVNITDDAGCGPVPTNVLSITEPEPLVTDSVVTDHISCNGSNDASIDIHISGGSRPYQFSVNDGSSYTPDSLFGGLGPGTYFVMAMDANGCTLPIDTVTFTQPPVITLSASITDVAACAGDLTGEISATASGGWESFTYSINGTDFQASGNFTGLAAGDYTIFTRDTGTCSASINVTVQEPDSVKATVTKTDYQGASLGSISITNATGGTPPYEYSIDGPGGTFTSTTEYNDLTAGNYEVVVRDAIGCMYREPVIIYDIIPINMVINPTDVTCYGEADGIIEFVPQDAVGEVQYSIDNGNTYTTNPLFENLPGDSTYILHAFDEDGKEYSGSVTINEPPELTVSRIVTPAECSALSETGAADITISGGTGDYDIQWSNGSTNEDLVNVVAGNYRFTITDEAGCELTDSVLISSLVVLVANAGKDTSVCAGATIELDALPGEVMQWDPPTYLSNTTIANPLVSGIQDSMMYTYTVVENSSPYQCADTDTLYVNVLPATGITLTQDTTIFEGQSVQLEVAETDFQSYSWFPATGLDADNVRDPLAAPLATTLYYVSAENQFGCLETDSVTVEVIQELVVYNVFSPNGDGINEFFDIENGYKFPNIVVEVYNRWGTKVFSTTGYSDDKRWDGTSNGKDAPVGTYYYVIVPYQGAEAITGNVTIIR